MPQSVDEVRNLSWEQLQQIFAAIVVDEIAAVTRNGGRGGRAKVAALSQGERRVLREALAETAG